MPEVTYAFHHIGIPTTEVQPDEIYSASFRMYSTPGNNPHRVQWHRFEEGCPLHPLIQTVAHVAFKVSDMERAIEGKRVILGPYFPFPRFRVAMVEIEGAPVEYLETDLSEDEIWGDAHATRPLELPTVGVASPTPAPASVVTREH